MLYTRRGDSGDTSVFGSPKGVRKTSPEIEALGALDEINSLLGVCKCMCEVRLRTSKSDFRMLIGDIQQDLFVIQAEAAGAPKKFPDSRMEEVEKEIDTIEKELPPIASFAVAGGTELAAMFDYARAVARRAERRVIAYKDSGGEVSDASLRYLNRLSSLLYALARLANAKAGVIEESPKYAIN
jgi:cob(I)alamin adenosyltransferase